MSSATGVLEEFDDFAGEQWPLTKPELIFQILHVIRAGGHDVTTMQSKGGWKGWDIPATLDEMLEDELIHFNDRLTDHMRPTVKGETLLRNLYGEFGPKRSVSSEEDSDDSTIVPTGDLSLTDE